MTPNPDPLDHVDVYPHNYPAFTIGPGGDFPSVAAWEAAAPEGRTWKGTMMTTNPVPPPHTFPSRATRSIEQSMSIEQSIQRINDLYAWAAEQDPPPARWRWRARREWRHRWGLTP